MEGGGEAAVQSHNWTGKQIDGAGRIQFQIQSNKMNLRRTMIDKGHDKLIILQQKTNYILTTVKRIMAGYCECFMPSHKAQLTT